MTITRQQVDAWNDEVDDAYKRGLHDGMKQERALWELSKLGQKIEAQPEQEPVAYLCENAVGHKYFRWKKPSSTYKPIALYTSPPAQRPWVGLTDEEVRKICVDEWGGYEQVRAIEAKLKEKNNAV